MSDQKIIRTKSRVEGGITATEKAALDKHARLWIERAFRTKAIEPDKIIQAIEGLYEVAGLKKPVIVIAPSPLVMIFAYGAAAAIWHIRGEEKDNSAIATIDAGREATDSATWNATRSATWNATRKATEKATDSATWKAISEATYQATEKATVIATRSATAIATWKATEKATVIATEKATDQATWNATYQATEKATDSATWKAAREATEKATDSATWKAAREATIDAARKATDDATWNAIREATATAIATWKATDGATWNATRKATEKATYEVISEAISEAINPEEIAAYTCRLISGDLGIACAERWATVYQGGNMWASPESLITGFRDIIGLDLKEYKNYRHWENASIHGGFRVVHEEFCIVSDFPEILKVDEQDRPHCENAPSHKWRDGWSLYHWHGVRIPAEWIETPESLTAKIALTQENMEKRRAACEILGWDKILVELDAEIIDQDNDPQIGTLYQVQLPDLEGKDKFLKVQCGTGRRFALGVPRKTMTALEAQSWVHGLSPSEFKLPENRT